MTARIEPRPPSGPRAAAVRSMFASIAPRYDLLNHLLSLSVDRYWRRRVVRRIGGLGPRPTDRCLDLCTGTGELAIEIRRRLGIEVIGSDFCHPMLVRFLAKASTRGLLVAEADAETLPFGNASFRFVSVAFGLRNIERRDRSLKEALRVLVPGGTLFVLEFSRPGLPVLRELFGFYFSHVLPRIGSWISGTDGPYAYLPDSVRGFPGQEALAVELREAGFSGVNYENLTFGIAAIHHGMKPGPIDPLLNRSRDSGD